MLSFQASSRCHSAWKFISVFCIRREQPPRCCHLRIWIHNWLDMPREKLSPTSSHSHKLTVQKKICRLSIKTTSNTYPGGVHPWALLLPPHHSAMPRRAVGSASWASTSSWLRWRWRLRRRAPKGGTVYSLSRARCATWAVPPGAWTGRPSCLRQAASTQNLAPRRMLMRTSPSCLR